MQIIINLETEVSEKDAEIERLKLLIKAKDEKIEQQVLLSWTCHLPEHNNQANRIAKLENQNA